MAFFQASAYRSTIAAFAAPELEFPKMKSWLKYTWNQAWKMAKALFCNDKVTRHPELSRATLCSCWKSSHTTCSCVWTMIFSWPRKSTLPTHYAGAVFLCNISMEPFWKLWCPRAPALNQVRELFRPVIMGSRILLEQMVMVKCISGKNRALPTKGMPLRRQPGCWGTLYVTFKVNFPSNNFADESQLKVCTLLDAWKLWFSSSTLRTKILMWVQFWHPCVCVSIKML